MPRVRTADLSVHAFHWLFAAGVAAAAVLSLALGRESGAFPLHRTVGLALAILVIIRIAWAMLNAARTGRTQHRASSAQWSALAMFALVLGLALTGLMMGRGAAGLGRLHAALAYGLVAAAVIHTAASVLHVKRGGPTTKEAVHADDEEHRPRPVRS